MSRTLRSRFASRLSFHAPARWFSRLALGALAVGCVGKGVLHAQQPAVAPAQVLISVGEQRLKLIRGGLTIATYPVSTSWFGLGDTHRSYRTPLGMFRVHNKVGDNLPLGAVLKGRRFTGEVLAVNAPGRDPIVTRIIQLQGLEAQNRHALSRGIYIHGTPEERNIGRPVSYGCIRMRSSDVVELYRNVPVGTPVLITTQRSPNMASLFASYTPEKELAAAARWNRSQQWRSVGGGATRTAGINAKAPSTSATAATATAGTKTSPSTPVATLAKRRSPFSLLSLEF